VHGLQPAEQAAIIAIFDEWGEVDRSHRKLAHRGSYERPGVGFAGLGPPGFGCSRPDSASAPARRAHRAAAVSGVGELYQALDLDL